MADDYSELIEILAEAGRDGDGASEIAAKAISRLSVESADAKEDALRLHKEKMDQYDRAIVAELRLAEAVGLIHDLLGFELGSSDRALEFLYQHMPQSPADREGKNG